MKDAHKGRGITQKEFDLVVGYVVKAMNTLAVPQPLQDEVTALLGPLKDEVCS